MAKVTAPLLSFRAAGQIGKAQVYASWRGVPYARQLVVPANPNTTAQQSTRGVFSSISDLWKNAGTLMRAPWIASIRGRPLTARNSVIGTNISAMRGDADRQDFIASPGANGGPAPTAVSATGGGLSGEIDVTITAPAAPTGWTLASAVAFALQDGDPKTLVPLPLGEAENASPTAGGNTAVTIENLEANTLHVVCGWLQWTKPDGTTAYGASLPTTATSTS